jgi:acyl-coenzyme A thioesterase PaaI-like protein
VSKLECYARLFGEFGAVLSDADWIKLANDCLPPNLAALNARIVAGSRRNRFLQISYRPGPESFTFIGLSGGCVAEMLDQAAAHCGTFLTSYGCPTLTMTANYLRPGTGSTFVATAGLLAVTSASAIIDAELTDERERLISSSSVVVQLVKDVSRYT